MAIINLRRYYPHYPKDKFIEVPDDVADALEEGRRIENRQDGKRTYYHVYSIDQSPAIENHAMFLVLSPEELMIQAEDEANANLMLERLANAMLLLSPTQARRLHARYTLKKKFRQIAADEGVSGSCAAMVPFWRAYFLPSSPRTANRSKRSWLPFPDCLGRGNWRKKC